MLERRRDGAVELLLIDRQAVRNALDAALTAELARALAAIGADAQARAVVLAGKGAGFCAGSRARFTASTIRRKRLKLFS